jgi:dTMP kinase
MFFSLDGPDGVGKSTQLVLIAEWLKSQGVSVITCRDPGSTSLGERVRAILLDRSSSPISPRAEMLLYMAARAQLVSEVIRPALDSGRVVLSDRYLLANVVYQGHAGGLDPAELWRIGMTAVDGLLPRRTVILDLDPHAASARINRPPDRMEQRGLAYQARVREGFLLEARGRPDELIVVDASRPIDRVQDDLRAIIAAELGLAASIEQGAP